LQLFRAINGTELEDKIERSVYNKRRKKLVGYTEKIRQSLSQKLAHLSNLFIVDSAPVQICKNNRAKRSNICATYEIKPAFGYCAAQKAHYFGYKLLVLHKIQRTSFIFFIRTVHLYIQTEHNTMQRLLKKGIM